MDSRQADDEQRAAERNYSFGYLLRRLRKARDLTQEALARRVGCTASTIHKIETDLRRPSRAIAERLAAIFDLAGEDHDAFVRAARAAQSSDQLLLPHRPETGSASVDTPGGGGVAPALPSPATAFVGRERELAVLAALLALPATRLVTLCGLGGIGKTRVALAVAERQRALAAAGSGRFRQGVIFVSLSGLSAVSQAEAAVAAALDLHLDHGPRSRRRQIVDYLRRKSLLLVLDGYERLLPNVALVDDIVAAAPAVTVLVTSRERLRLRSECVLTLDGLAVPPDDVADSAMGYDAVRFFLQSARRVRPGYEPSARAMESIAAICRLVEGVPLAIELAAAWVTVLPPPAILAELQRGSDLLATELRDVPARQRSMQAVYDACWQRLGPPERQLFARLSCFHGGFTLEAAQQVTGAELAQLAHLVELALLRHDRERDRFTIHEQLRHYGARQLARDSAAQLATRQAYASHYLSLLVRHAAGLQGPGQLAALAALRAEDANLRAAWQSAVELQIVTLLDHAADSLGCYYEWRGLLHEGEAAFHAAGEAAFVRDDGPEQLRLQARILAWHGAFSDSLGRLEEAESALRKSLEMLDHAAAGGIDPRAEQAFALWRLARLRAREGHEDAARLYERSLAVYRAIGRHWEMSAVLSELGDLRSNQGHVDDALAALRESQLISERSGDLRGMVQTLQMLSRSALDQGATDTAERMARRAAELARTLGSRASVAATLGRLGTILMHTGRYEEAADQLRESLALAEDLGAETMIALAHARLALALLHLGAVEEGRSHAQMSIALSPKPDGQILGQGLFALALAERSAGDAGAADALLEEGGELSRTHSLAVMRGIILAEQSTLAWALGDAPRARARAVEALRLAVAQHNAVILEVALLACLEPLVAAGQTERAATLYGLGSEAPLWQESHLVAPLRGRILAAIGAALPPETLAAALERGRGLERWATARELLDALEGAGWGEGLSREV